MIGLAAAAILLAPLSGVSAVSVRRSADPATATARGGRAGASRR